MGVGEGAALDSGEGVAQRHGHLAGLAVTDGELALAVLHLGHRGDHRRRAAGEDLGDLSGGHPLAPFLDVDLALLDGESGITGQLQQRVPGDAGQQRAAEFGGDQSRRSAASEDEEQVHPAHLLDIAPFDGVQPHHLVAAVSGGFGLGQQRRGVVAAELRRTGSAGAGSHVLGGQPHADGLDAALEVRPGRGGDQQIAVFRRRPHAQARLGGDDERPQVERLLAAGLGHPLVVDRDQLAKRLEEQLVGELRNRQPTRRGAQPGGVGVGAEGHDRPVAPPVGLESLEDFLRVVQDDRRGIQFDRAVGHHPGVEPAPFGGVEQRDHVVGVVLPEARIGQNRSPLGRARRVRGALDGELQRGRRHSESL